jgi:hypothetical protein
MRREDPNRIDGSVEIPAVVVGFETLAVKRLLR